MKIQPIGSPEGHRTAVARPKVVDLGDGLHHIRVTFTCVCGAVCPSKAALNEHLDAVRSQEAA